jgi:hypothetical protein
MRLTHHSLFPHGHGVRVVRVNVWRIARRACYGEGGIMYDDGRLWVETQKYERQCAGCRKWFWAWRPERTHCYFCQPLPRAELTRFRAALDSGNGHGHGTGHTGFPALVLTPWIRPAGAIGAGGVRGGGTNRAVRPADLCGAPASR